MDVSHLESKVLVVRSRSWSRCLRAERVAQATVMQAEPLQCDWRSQCMEIQFSIPVD